MVSAEWTGNGTFKLRAAVPSPAGARVYFILHFSRLSHGPTQPSFQWERKVSPLKYVGRSVKLTIHIHIVSRVKYHVTLIPSLAPRLHENNSNLLTWSPIGKGKGKTFHIEVWTGPEESRRLRLSEFLDNRHMKVTRLSALNTGRPYPKSYCRFSFLLKAESNPGPQWSRKE